jgi:hypothetical protein
VDADLLKERGSYTTIPREESDGCTATLKVFSFFFLLFRLPLTSSFLETLKFNFQKVYQTISSVNPINNTSELCITSKTIVKSKHKINFKTLIRHTLGFLI